MNYLELVNKVIQESGSEKDELNSSTWSTSDTGTRIYPRIKRNVRDAWKMLQMERDEWEFKTGSFSEVIYPRVKLNGGSRAAGSPPVGTVFVGDSSGFSMTLKANYTTGSWVSGVATGQLEFEVFSGTRLIPGETFTELTPIPGDGSFVYIGKGSYDFLEINSDIREIAWTSLFAGQSNAMPYPIRYVPWDNWAYNEYNFTVSSANTPFYVSQDFEGKTVFYPQTLNSFRLNFIYDAAPQILADKNDEIVRLPEEYHDWIAWSALMMFALYDKNPTLYSYASKGEAFFRRRAERNLMPLVSRAESKFND